MKSIIWLFSAWLCIYSVRHDAGIADNHSSERKHVPPDVSEHNGKDKKTNDYRLFDILINEIMPDPSPGVYLPEYEYIELVNISGKTVFLEGWTLEVGTKLYSLSGEMDEGEFLIITYIPAVNFFRIYGKILGLFTSSTALTNTGQILILRDGDGNLIDAVQYADSWYGDTFKMQGGWSLERIDHSLPCAGKENWTVSVSPQGGTPGKTNSVNASVPDIASPYVTGVQLISECEINILFSETIDRNFFTSDNPFSITEGNNTITRITPCFPFYNSCRLHFEKSFIEGEIYRIIVNDDFCDCSGNKPPQPLTLRFGKPLPSGFTDVILTEVLYAPFPGCAEFIEIYNNTTCLLDLSGIIISLTYGEQPEVKREYLTSEQYLFFPGEYLVISPDPLSLSGYYHVPYPERLFTMKKMPALRDGGGCIELADRSLQLIDRYCYSGNAHYPLLNDDHGVSLERMDICPSPGYLSRWHSASSLSGFATPGYTNSQMVEILPTDGVLTVDPGLFTPDNDGNDDVAVISFHIGSGDFTGNIYIYNAMGRQVRYLARNEILGFNGHFIWDGTDDRGQLAATGIYLILFDAFNLKGEKIRKKATVLLVRR